MLGLRTTVAICLSFAGMISMLQADIVDYLAKDHGEVRYDILEEKVLDGGMRSVVMELHSQVWQGIPWSHRLRMLIPEKTVGQAGILLIGGSRPKPDKEKSEIHKMEKRGREVAEGVAAPVALLYDIPNQPLYGGLTEDRLVAETFRRYRDTKDPDWPILFPMVKAVVKAMDVVTEVCQQRYKIKCEQFMLTGASKRGWTTWLTSSVDSRVFGIAPMVYDNLNLRAQMQHQLDSWGKYSPSISAYTKLNLPQLLLNEEGGVTALADLVDPWTRRSKITMPKLLIHGSNDPFWVADSMNIYKDDLVGETHVHVVPNGDHGLHGGREGVISTTVTFFKSLQGRLNLPQQKVEWKPLASGGCELHFSTDGEAFDVSLWNAEHSVRDFRKAKWYPEPLEELGDGRYRLTYEPKAELWRGAFVQAVYVLDGEECSLSSEIVVLKPKKSSK